MPFSDVKAVSDELMFMGSKYGGDGPAAAPPADYTGTVGAVDGGMFRALVANGYTQLARNKDELCAPLSQTYPHAYRLPAPRPPYSPGTRLRGRASRHCMLSAGTRSTCSPSPTPTRATT